jgi:hypothetical protein
MCGMTEKFPILRSVVLDTTDARGLAEFYRLAVDSTTFLRTAERAVASDRPQPAVRHTIEQAGRQTGVR